MFVKFWGVIGLETRNNWLDEVHPMYNNNNNNNRFTGISFLLFLFAL